MKILTHILAVVIFLGSIIACSSGTKTEEPKLTTDANSNGTKLETPKTNSNSSIPLTNTGNDIAGTYSVNGLSIDSKKYDGEMIVTKRDDVYQFSWTVGGSSYDGVGVQSGNSVAVAYSNGANGKGCGAVIYKIGSDDSLEGKWGEWGINQIGTEKAIPNEKTTNKNGVFDVTGTTPDGKSYKGKLNINRASEDVYQFTWDIGTKSIGTGIKMGEYLAAGSGSKQCGFVIYEVKNGSLEGKWGVPGTTKLGTETATKK